MLEEAVGISRVVLTVGKEDEKSDSIVQFVVLLGLRRTLGLVI